MAITLAFGLATGTAGTLIVLPSLLRIVEDARSVLPGKEPAPANADREGSAGEGTP